MAGSGFKVLCLVLCWCLFGAGICLGQGKRDCVVEKAQSYVGVREATGRNDGEQVEKFLALTGFGPGYAWCAAYMSYIYHECKVDSPVTAWSPSFGLAKDAVWKQGEGYQRAQLSAKPGDAFTIYYSSKGRIGHVGMYLYSTINRVYTIEGNTNQAGSREGDGVYHKARHWNQVYRITNYIDK